MTRDEIFRLLTTEELDALCQDQTRGGHDCNASGNLVTETERPRLANYPNQSWPLLFGERRHSCLNEHSRLELGQGKSWSLVLALSSIGPHPSHRIDKWRNVSKFLP